MKKCYFCGEEIPDATVVCPWCGRRQQGTDTAPKPPPSEAQRKADTAKKDAEGSSIASVRLFTEPPAWLPDVNYVTTGLPKDFIETADRELKLNGELVSYVKAHGDVLPVEKIPRMGDSESQAFFSQQAKSGLWRVYYGSGASGVRYSILVEFRVRETGRSRNEESRRLIYAEFEELLDKAMIKYTLDCLRKGKTPDSEDVANQAMSSASHEVMCKHGILTQEMMDIIAEGTSKWSKLKFEK